MRNEALMSKIAFRQGHVLIGSMVDSNIHETKDSNLLIFGIKKQSFPFPAHIGAVHHYIRVLRQNLR